MHLLLDHLGYSISSWIWFFNKILFLSVALILMIGLIGWSGCFHWLYSFVMYRLNLPFSKTLPPRLDTFVGRENDTKMLLELLRFNSGSNTKIVNIISSPGFGKSTLAIEVGNKMVEERVVVHYVNMAEFPNMQVRQVLAEKVLKSATLISQPNVTFPQLVDWVGRTVWYNLLILDDCDDSIYLQKDDFYEAIETLVKYSQYLKILLTSREETMHMYNFRAHKIETLDTSAACELLEHKIPQTLTLAEKEKIAELTGNVPLALQIIGSLLNMPDPPSPAKIIKKLGQDPISTLTPSAMRYKLTVNASISLSYNYLKHGRYIANFPGSFDLYAATECLVLISNDPQKTTTEYFESSVTKLVSLSLLEHNKRSDQYHFHRLIREFFLGIQSSSDGIQEKKKFKLAFQQLFSNRLTIMTNTFLSYSSQVALGLLERDRHNIQHLLALITSPVNITHDSYHDSYYAAVHSIEYALTAEYLRHRFTSEELVGPIQCVTNVLEKQTLSAAKRSVQNYGPSHTPDQNHFFMFVRYVVRLSDLRADLNGRSSAYYTLRNHLYVVETIAQQQIMSGKDFAQGYSYYYTTLLQFKEYLDDDHTRTFTARLLQKLNHWQTYYCSPRNCENKDIGYAYYHISEYGKSIEFFKKALNDSNLELSTRVDLIIKLYSAYQRVNIFEQCQTLFEDLILLYPMIDATFNTDIKLSRKADDLILVFHLHGEHEKATTLRERQIEIVLGSDPQTKLSNNIGLIHSALSIAKDLYLHSNYTRAVEIASVALKALDESDLSQEEMELWDTTGLHLKLKLTIGKGKYHNDTHEDVASEGVLMLMEVADYIIERDDATIFTTEFAETCKYLEWHLKYIYSCQIRDSDLLYYANTVFGALFYGIFFIPLAKIEKQRHIMLDESLFQHDLKLPLDKYPPLRQDSHLKELTTKEWTALAEFYPDMNESGQPEQDNSYIKKLITTAINFLLKIGQVRFMINVLSVWIRLCIAYYGFLYTLKCFCCVTVYCCRGIRSIPIVLATIQAFIVLSSREI